MYSKATNRIMATVWFLVVMLGILYTPHATWATDIDATNKWAWSTNAGWLNFKDTNGEARVYADHLEGYVWAENVGWIRLGTNTTGGSIIYGNTTTTNYGVNRNATTGQLSGYGWSTNAGWINFGDTNGGASIDLTTGDFSGYVWAANVGWVKLNGTASNSTAYKVKMANSTLTVTNGTGTGSYLPGKVVTISANTSGAGIVFDKWVGQTSHIANINLPNTTINMPFSGGPTDSLSSLLNTIISMLSLDSASTSTTVEATYKSEGGAHVLTVTNGTGSGSYKAGTVVNISANTPAAGSIFNKWIGQSEPLENINNATTTVYMPSNDMAVQATYNNLVTATANAGGTVSPASQSVANGNTTQFTATPIVSYCNRLDTVNGNCPAGTWSGNTYTTGIITTGCLVTFNFECAYPPPPPDPLPPTLLVDPSGRAVDREAGTTTFTVNNGGNGALNWSAAVTSQSSWLSITSGASGVNSGTIVISYTANTSNESRTAAIRVTADGAKGSPKDVTITQAEEHPC